MGQILCFWLLTWERPAGRSILGTLRDGKLQMKELTRFPEPDS